MSLWVVAFRPTLEYKEMRGREKWYLRSSYSLIVFSGKQKTKCKLVKIEFHHSVLYGGDSECSFGDMDFSVFGMNWCLKRKFLTFCKIAQFTARSCFVYNIYFLRKWVCSKRLVDIGFQSAKVYINLFHLVLCFIISKDILSPTQFLRKIGTHYLFCLDTDQAHILCFFAIFRLYFFPLLISLVYYSLWVFVHFSLIMKRKKMVRSCGPDRCRILKYVLDIVLVFYLLSSCNTFLFLKLLL